MSARLTSSPAEPSRTRAGWYPRFGKRVLDVVLAIIGLAVALPIFLFCSVAIPLDSPGPVFFRQIRVGRHGLRFWIVKFRTMTAGSRGPAVTAGGDPRITRLGKWLRAAKVDEVPQLLNILRGEMSFVGPRPEVPRYVAMYTGRQAEVLRMKPGLTGPASLRFVHEEDLLAGASNREELYVHALLPEKLRLEMDYCAHANLWTDLKLIGLTGLRLL